MKLNQREREAAHVMIDLFMKGGPEMRIAEYLFNKGFTKNQVYHFLFDGEKLGDVMTNLDQTAWNIYKYFCHLNEDQQDWSRRCGQKLHNAVHKKDE